MSDKDNKEDPNKDDKHEESFVTPPRSPAIPKKPIDPLVPIVPLNPIDPVIQIDPIIVADPEVPIKATAPELSPLHTRNGPFRSVSIKSKRKITKKLNIPKIEHESEVEDTPKKNIRKYKKAEPKAKFEESALKVAARKKALLATRLHLAKTLTTIDKNTVKSPLSATRIIDSPSSANPFDFYRSISAEIQTAPPDIKHFVFPPPLLDHMKRKLEGKEDLQPKNIKLTPEEEEERRLLEEDNLEIEMVDPKDKPNADILLHDPNNQRYNPDGTENANYVPPPPVPIDLIAGGDGSAPVQLQVNTINQEAKPVPNYVSIFKDISFTKRMQGFVGDDQRAAHAWIVEACNLITHHSHRYQDQDILFAIGSVFVTGSPADVWWSVQRYAIKDWKTFVEEFNFAFCPQNVFNHMDPHAVLKATKQLPEGQSFGNFSMLMQSKLPLIQALHKPSDKELFEYIKLNMLVKYKRDADSMNATTLKELTIAARKIDELDVAAYQEEQRLTPGRTDVNTIERIAIHRAGLKTHINPHLWSASIPKKADINQVEAYEPISPLDQRTYGDSVNTAGPSDVKRSLFGQNPQKYYPSSTNYPRAAPPSPQQSSNATTYKYRGKEYQFVTLTQYLCFQPHLVRDEKMRTAMSAPDFNPQAAHPNSKEPLVACIPQDEWYRIQEKPFKKDGMPCFGCGWDDMQIRNCPRCRTNGDFKRAKAYANRENDRSDRGDRNDRNNQNRGNRDNQNDRRDNRGGNYGNRGGNYGNRDNRSGNYGNNPNRNNNNQGNGQRANE
jgi:hypothetical protein